MCGSHQNREDWIVTAYLQPSTIYGDPQFFDLFEDCSPESAIFPIPSCSIYGIFTYMFPKNGPNVGRYSLHGAYGIEKPYFLLGKSPLCHPISRHPQPVQVKTRPRAPHRPPRCATSCETDAWFKGGCGQGVIHPKCSMVLEYVLRFTPKIAQV